MAEGTEGAEVAPPHSAHAGGLLEKWKQIPTSQKWLIVLGGLTLLVTAYLGLRSAKSNAVSSGGSIPIDGSAGASDQLSSNAGGTGSSSGGDGLGGSTGGSSSGGIVGTLTGPTGIATAPGGAGPVNDPASDPGNAGNVWQGIPILGTLGASKPGSPKPIQPIGGGVGPGGEVDPWAQLKPGSGMDPTSPFNNLKPTSSPGGAPSPVDPWAQFKPGGSGGVLPGGFPTFDPWGGFRPSDAAHVTNTANGPATVDHSHSSIGWNVTIPRAAKPVKGAARK